MTLRNSTLALLVALFVAMPAWAQQGPANSVDRRLEMLDDRLDLTDEQEAEIHHIWTQHREAMKSWAATHKDATRDERREYFRSRADEMHSAVQAVLTPEQAKKHAEIRDARRDRVHGGRMGMRGESKGRSGGRGVGGQRDDGRAGRGMQRTDDGRAMRGGGPGMFAERIAAEFELSDAQRDEVQDIIESHRSEGAEWREANPDATREQMQAYHEGHFAKLKTELEHVLTPDQLERFEELHEGLRGRMSPRQGRN